MAFLRVIRGHQAGQVYQLSDDIVTLGRSPTCDIVLDLGAVSRQHARIFRRGLDYFIEDLNSRNGTYVNHRRVNTPVKLADEDVIRICSIELMFHSGQGRHKYDATSQEGLKMLIDDDQLAASSTIMSRVDISTGAAGLHIAVKPEIKLRALLEITRNLARAVSLNEVLPKVLDGLFAIFLQADRGFIVLRDPQTGQLIPKAVKQRESRQGAPIRISRTILNSVINSKEAILSADAATDTRFDSSESVVDFHIHSMMCAPLVSTTGEVLGVIQLDTCDQRRRFTQEDLEVLASVACQAAIAVENAQLHEIALEQAEIRRELANAQRLQQGFLPAAPPEIPGYRFYDYYDPAKELGGDFFTYVQMPDGRVAVVVADVSGKGFSASLLVARLSADTPQTLLTERTPADALAKLNNIFCDSRWEDRFVTIAVAVLDPERHTAELVSAGHLPPLLHNKEETKFVGKEITGLPLGVIPDVTYESETVSLMPGDTLILYTDGVVEAMNAQRKIYGEERLKQLLTGKDLAVDELGQEIIEDVRRFVGDHPQSDDMCLVCAGRLR